MLATADYFNCLYFWNMLPRFPQANPYNPAARLQEAWGGAALLRGGSCAEAAQGAQIPPELCSRVQRLRMGSREDRANGTDVMDLHST